MHRERGTIITAKQYNDLDPNKKGKYDVVNPTKDQINRGFAYPEELCPCGSEKKYKDCHLKLMTAGQRKRFYKRIGR